MLVRRVNRYFLSLAIIMVMMLPVALAQKPGQTPSPKQPGTVAVTVPNSSISLSAKENPKDRQFALTPAREAAVMAFVDRNHPELAGLLSHLKVNQSKEYERAVRDLFRVTEKLATVQERDGKQYDLELKAWQAQSRAQLLVARLKMTEPDSADSEQLKDQLREVLSEQMQARLEVLKLERDRVSGRLAKLTEEISRLEKNRGSVVETHLKNLNSQVNGNRPKQKSPEKKPARTP